MKPAIGGRVVIKHSEFSKYESVIFSDTVFINEAFTQKLRQEVNKQGDTVGIFVYHGFAFAYFAAQQSLSVCAKGFIAGSQDQVFALSLSDISTIEWLDDVNVRIGFRLDGALQFETLQASELEQFRMVGFFTDSRGANLARPA